MSSHGTSSSTRVPRVEEEPVIGLEDEVEKIKERLYEERGQLEVVSIVGMAGLGKTRLARKVYDDPFVVYHFYIRGWTSVSQVYTNRALLVSIVCSAFHIKADEISAKTEEELREQLYRSLKDKRYLIVMDDIWDIGVWTSLRRCLPNDDNGSKVMFTTRLKDLALQAQPNSPPHCLRFLNQRESWDLLRQKVFQGGIPPLELLEIGNQIAKKCEGLPLAIVVVAGLLSKTETTLDWWRQVASSVGSYIASDPKQYMDTLALSYHHLPLELKACFLYFGVFPEDYDIPVRILIWLWIAEGFISEIGQKSFEDVAEEYLKELVDRNLVLVAKTRSNGGIKACRIHDLLRDLCLNKAKEEHFLYIVSFKYRGVSSHSSSTKKFYRPCIHSGLKHFLHIISSKYRDVSSHSSPTNDLVANPLGSHTRSFLCFASERNPFPAGNTLSFFKSFQRLTVLDLFSIHLPLFPQEIVQWQKHLRYLAVWFKDGSLPNSISNLTNLEFLVVHSCPIVPKTVWNMIKLRHLYIRSGENLVEDPCFEETRRDSGRSVVFGNLQTISQIRPSRTCQDVLARTPNLRKLRFCGELERNEGDFWFPCLDNLGHLEKLTLFTQPKFYTKGHLSSCKFPLQLKTLTLYGMGRKWKEMSIIGALPNLEVLKLLVNAFAGPRWETNDGGFVRLKVLKASYIATLKQWKTSRTHFPNLERLVLHNCWKLEEIPSELGYVSTLQMIEVHSSSVSAANSARRIQEEQQFMGNDGLKILISL